MLGKEIQKLRRSRGLSQEKLAEQMEVSRQAISKWESGAAVPEVEKLIQLARLFEVSVDRLLGLEPSEQEAPPDALPGAAAPGSLPNEMPAGATPPPGVTGEQFRVLEGMVADLAREIPGAVYCPTLEQVTEKLKELAQPGDLILTVGAGNIYTAGEALLQGR